MNYAGWGLTARTALSFKTYVSFRTYMERILPLLRVGMKSNTHTWNDFGLKQRVNLELGPSLVSVAVGVSLLPPGLMSLSRQAGHPNPASRTADGLHTKKSHARTSRAGIRRWHSSVDKRTSAWPTCWMARLVRWEIHDYHSCLKKAGARIRNRAANSNLPRWRKFTARCIFRSSGSLDREAAGLVDTWYQHHWSFRDSIQEGS